MIKQFVTILIVCFSSIECFSQNNQSTFLFPEFTEAIVHYKDGRAFQVPINYNLLESNFIFIDKDKKKKEQFKDPVDKLLKRSAVNATFSNDVKRESSPAVLIFVAASIAAIAVMLGIRGLIDRKRNGESDEI